MTELKTLKEIPLREHFKHEEDGFTPWLMDHLDLLASDDLLGFELEEARREVSVGSYSADIVAQGATVERTVIIENQFGTTDHEHLGQSLVYAAGKEADVAVWIAEEFTSEHVETLQMVNRRSDRELALFGLEAGLRQIGDSPYAIDFVPVVRPEGWNPVESDAELSETQKAQLQFWEAFRSELRSQGLAGFASRQARGKASYDIAIGFSEAYIRPTARFRHDTLHCLVRITDRDGNMAGLAEEKFRQRIREVTEDIDTQQIYPGIADEIDWQPKPDGKYDIIGLDYGDASFTDQDKWPEYHQWLAETVQVFDTVLSEQLG